jgi:hypothetical protein
MCSGADLFRSRVDRTASVTRAATEMNSYLPRKPADAEQPPRTAAAPRRAAAWATAPDRLRLLRPSAAAARAELWRRREPQLKCDWWEWRGVRHNHVTEVLVSLPQLRRWNREQLRIREVPALQRSQVRSSCLLVGTASRCVPPNETYRLCGTTALCRGLGLPQADRAVCASVACTSTNGACAQKQGRAWRGGAFGARMRMHRT